MRMSNDLGESARREINLRSAKQYAYDRACPLMSRADRRTAKGRMLVAQGEAAALRVENEFLKWKLGMK